MASPFPGMDPYLEDPAFWRDFHHEFIGCWREAIADQLPESYEARLDETVNLVHMDDVIQKIYPDVAVSRTRRSVRARTKATGTLLLEPVTIPHEYLDEERQGRIHILHRPDRTLVTVFDKTGKQIEHIPVPEPWTANVCFGGADMQTLFITAGKGLYGLKMKVKGASQQYRETSFRRLDTLPACPPVSLSCTLGSGTSWQHVL